MTPKIFESEYRFCLILWEHEPIKSTDLMKLCKEKNVGFVGMKALSGGLVTDARIPFAYLSEFDNVVPIWGF